MSAAVHQHRFPWWVYWAAFAFIALFTLWPVGSILATAAIADANGCRVDEGSVHPCMVLGSDWGATLYTMGVLGWFMLITVPLGLGAFIVWLIVLLIHHAAWARQSKPVV